MEDKYKKTNKTIRFWELVPGILSILWRLPPICRTLKEYFSYKDDTSMSIGRLLERNARIFSDRNALIFEDQTYTYNSFNEQVNRYANYFLNLGVKKGDTIAVFLENRPELLFCIGAASKIGAVASLINANLQGQMLQHCFETAPPEIFLIGEELVEPFEAIKEKLQSIERKRIMFISDQGLRPAPSGFIDMTERIKTFPKTNPSTTANVKIKDPFAYIFTSGTTGFPKAAIQFHKSWVGAYHWIGKVNLNLNQNDTVYVPLPFFHSTAVKVIWPPAVAGGAAIALRRKFSASNFWNDIRRLNATSFVYIGELCSYLINQPQTPEDHKNPIKKIIGNGLRPEIWQEFKQRFSIPKIYEFYGASESPILFMNTLNIDETVGMCFFPPSAVVKYDMEAGEPIKDENGFLKRIGPGETGLLLGKIRNMDLFSGYTDTKATEKKVFRDVFEKDDAWFNTGDLIRDIGYKNYQFVDRLGDTFRWKGENVATTEVEKVVNAFHQIEESTVYGVTIPGFDGRIGMAAIIPYNGAKKFDLKAFADLLQRSLPSYAVPRFLRFKTEFETTQTFKIKKGKLQKEGFSLDKTDDPLYVFLPKAFEYVQLTQALYKDIVEGKYRF